METFRGNEILVKGCLDSLVIEDTTNDEGHNMGCLNSRKEFSAFSAGSAVDV